MANHKSYGSFDSAVDQEAANDEDEARRCSSDTMRSQVNSTGSESLSSANGRRKEDVEMQPLADDPPNEAHDSDSDTESDMSAQAGVKRAEAISSTWTKMGLYAAYLGCATSHPLKRHDRPANWAAVSA